MFLANLNTLHLPNFKSSTPAGCVTYDRNGASSVSNKTREKHTISLLPLGTHEISLNTIESYVTRSQTSLSKNNGNLGGRDTRKV